MATLNHVITEDPRTNPHVLTVSFAGDGTNAAVTSINYTLTAKALATTITVTNVTGPPGSTVNLTSTLKSGTTALSGKTVEFDVDGTSVGTATTNASGIATLPHVLSESAGTTHVLTAKFAGDAVYAAVSKNGTLIVQKIATTLTVSNISGKVGAATTLKATLKAGSTALSGATVSISVDGSLVGTTTTNATGVASVPFTIPAGAGVAHSITASYAGDSTYNSSTGTGTLTITAAATKLTGETKTATPGSSVDLGAKLIRTTDSTALSGMTVTFYDSTGTTVVGTGTTDASGRASITVTAPAHGVVVKYVVKFAGTTNYTASSGGASVKGS